MGKFAAEVCAPSGENGAQVQNGQSSSHLKLLPQDPLDQGIVGESVESALSALAAIFWLLARSLTIFDKNIVF